MYAPQPEQVIWPLVDHAIAPELPNLSRATVAGISVAISGNVLISLALNCQKLAHKRLERERASRREAVDAYSNRNAHIVKRDGQVNGMRISEEDDNELAWTGGVSAGQDASITTQCEGEDASETQPLLAQSDRTLVHRPPVLHSHKNSVFARLVPWLKQADHVYVESAHSLIPVDMVTVQPSNDAEEHASGKNNEDSDNGNESDYLRSKLWWLGFTLMNIGEMGNFISYAFAPASVVAPLGTFALVANCVFAPLMLKERFRKRDFFGILVAVVGAVTVVLSANTSDTRLDPDALLRAISQRVFIVFSIVYVTAAIILCGLSEGNIGKRHVFVDVGLCAIFGGFTVLSTKAISTLLTKEWLEIFAEWITYPILAVLIGTGVGQIRYLNRALMRFDSKIVVPTQFVMFNLSAIVGSAILYGDFKRASFHQIVTFLYGCAATFAGVFIIAWDSSGPGPDQNSEACEDTSTTDGEGDVEAAITAGDDSTVAISREVRTGSLSRRDRPTLVIPDVVAAQSPAATPILRNRQSMVSMIGLSPAQRVLLVHTPPREDFLRPLSQDLDHENSSPGSSSHDHRRRAISWIDGSTSPARGTRRIRSNVGSREGSLTRTNRPSNLTPRVASHPQ